MNKRTDQALDMIQLWSQPIRAGLYTQDVPWTAGRLSTPPALVRRTCAPICSRGYCSLTYQHLIMVQLPVRLAELRNNEWFVLR